MMDVSLIMKILGDVDSVITNISIKKNIKKV